MKRICIARIADAHGVKGLVKLSVFAENMELFDDAPALFTSESGEETLRLTLKNATAKHWLAEIEGVSDRNAALALKGTRLYIDREILPDTDEDEYYYHDLIGLKAMDESGQEIGTVTAIQNFGASDMLDIKPFDGTPSFYLPFTDDTVPQVDLKSGTMTIVIPEGLRE